MKLTIKRIDKSLPLPEYKTKGAVAFDFYSRIDAVIKPGELKLLPNNLIIKVPKGYSLLMFSRSSGPKKGYFLANGVGVFDQDYCGPDDEMWIQLFNYTKKSIKILRGERIAQGMLVPIARVQWREINVMKAKTRGGLGSTGSK